MRADVQEEHDFHPAATWSAPYFIGLGRAMVSLGPVSNTNYCSYRCRFCYVQGPFPRYASATVSEIALWLADRREQYDIVYISGDTDSFAAPRTREALDLLEALLHLNVDVLFTTRYVFEAMELQRLGNITRQYQAQGLLLIGCISISQLYHEQLEPSPIKSPYRRAQLLGELRELGIITALTIRPFIPSIPASEYCEIALLAGESADVILGGDLYVDSSGAVEKGLRSAGEDLEIGKATSNISSLDFSLSSDDWITLTHPEAVAQVGATCKAIGKPFFIRSAGAIEWIRERRNAFTER
jgi:hypothetical protein